MDLARWLGSIAHDARPLLVASDFDGTLSNIAPRPGDAVLREGARAVLQHLSWNPRVHLAIISGRPLEDLRERCRLGGRVWYAGEHGAELLTPDGARLEESGEKNRAVAALSRAAEEIVRQFPGAALEFKPRGASFHVRHVAPALQHEALEAFRGLCVSLGAATLKGRKVLEASYAAGDKGSALRRIRAEVGGDPLTVYAGDDETDASALRFTAELQDGLALYIRSGERPAPGCLVSGVLRDPAEWVWTLNEIARVLG